MPEQIGAGSAHRETNDIVEQRSWGRWVVVVAAALVLAVVLVAGFYLTARTLALLFAAIVIAEAIAPLIDRLESKMPRGVAVGGVYLLLVGAVSGLLWFIVPELAGQASALADRIPDVADEVTSTVEEVSDAADGAGVPAIQNLRDTLGDVAAGLTTAIVTFSGTLVSSIAQILLIGFMSAYWLISRSALFGFIRSLAPSDGQDAIDGTLDALSATVGGYVRGVAISAVMIGLLSWTGLTIIGVEYALVLALVAGFGEFLPVIGPIIAAVPAVAVALFDSPVQALIVAGFYLMLQQVESNIITPNVMRNQADVPPLLTIVAISAGGTIGGILGALIAIPLAGVLKVLIVQVAAPGIRRWTGAVQAPTTVEEAQERADAG
jgi:predicted PurR-regulated permease PerM